MANQPKQLSPAVSVVIIVIALLIVVGIGWYFINKPKDYLPPEDMNVPGPGQYPIERTDVPSD